MSKYTFGEIAGQHVGSTYANRKQAMYARLHVNWVKGISGNRHEGCDAICLNGGYDTDEDYGHEIFYTGSGGQDPTTKQAVRDQELDDSDNAALVMSQHTGLPIRILRGPKGDADYSPAEGYRYDGLYKVIKHFPNVPADGHRRWMFHLVQLTPQEAAVYTPRENERANAKAFRELDLGSGPLTSIPATPPEVAPVDPFSAPGEQTEIVIPAGKTDPAKKVVIYERVIRDTKVTAAVKAMYGNACQICATRIATKNGAYSEGAHIRPLGGIHHGPDTMDNILCLCPNHHAAFDKGGIYIDDGLHVHEAAGDALGALKVDDAHDVDLNNIRYHRTHHGHLG